MHHPRYRSLLITAALLLLVAALPTPAASAAGQAAERCFPETGFCVQGRFLDYWTRGGNLAAYGYPISDSFSATLEDGNAYEVQYFERVRMEYHPENAAPHDLLLGQFGRRIVATVPGAPVAPVAPDPAGPATRFFPETGHNVRGTFAGYWQVYGGLARFGYPVSEAFEERLEDGHTYRVQYFERARFEYHPELASQWQILLGQFGRRILAEETGTGR